MISFEDEKAVLCKKIRKCILLQTLSTVSFCFFLVFISLNLPFKQFFSFEMIVYYLGTLSSLFIMAFTEVKIKRQYQEIRKREREFLEEVINH